MTNLHDDNAATESAAPTPTPAGERSLGYWLRAADALISRDAAERFAAEGATRRDLRILTALSETTEMPERLRERLERGGKRLSALAKRGWIERVDGAWRLTDAGDAARDRLAALTQQTRDRAAGAVSAEDLDVTLASLEAIAREYGWTEDMRLPRRGARGPRAGHSPQSHGGPCGHREHGHREHGGYGRDRGASGGEGRCDGHRQDRGRGEGRGFGEGRGYGYGRGRDSGYGQDRHFGRGQDRHVDHGFGFGHGHGHWQDRGRGENHGFGHGPANGQAHNQAHGQPHGHGGPRDGGRAASFE